MEFRLGELFSGSGGIGYAALMANATSHNGEKFTIKHVWATDYNKDACETYANNIIGKKSKSVICSDIRNLDFSKLGEISTIDGLAFGFPCNDFSMVGEQKGIKGTFGPLYSYGVKALKKFQPMWFLAENVGGLISSNEGNAFKIILKELEECGYKITPHLYKFEEYGVPQTRHRIIIVGIRNDIKKEFKVPSPKPFSNIDNSSRTAIEEPPILSDAHNHEQTKHATQVIERLKHIKAGENAFNAKLPKELELNVKGAKISQIYRRLHPQKPAYTVTGSGGGGTHVYHWKENRALTNRERARLQTFPDNFIFYGSKESVRKQIGMAVPPKGVRIIFDAILNTFAEIDYEYIENNINLEY
jgi:DNA (cytosine-5)-methyltransferase 1